MDWRASVETLRAAPKAEAKVKRKSTSIQVETQNSTPDSENCEYLENPSSVGSNPTGATNPYAEYKVYGPYCRKDGREHVVLVSYDKTKRKTVSYPKYLVETRRGSLLAPGETVDHIDGDVLNNHPDNLQVLRRSVHCALDVPRLKAQTFKCPECSSKFVLEGTRLSRTISNRKKGRTGPFCSRSCTGKYGAWVQNGGARYPVVRIKKTTYRLKDQD